MYRNLGTRLSEIFYLARNFFWKSLLKQGQNYSFYKFFEKEKLISLFSCKISNDDFSEFLKNPLEFLEEKTVLMNAGLYC